MSTSNDLEQAIISVVGADKLAQPVFAPDEDVSFPYVRLMPDVSEAVQASDRSWILMTNYNVLLCTAQRDRAIARRMERAFEAAGIGFEKVEYFYDKTERVFYANYFVNPVQESEE